LAELKLEKEALELQEKYKKQEEEKKLLLLKLAEEGKKKAEEKQQIRAKKYLNFKLKQKMNEEWKE